MWGSWYILETSTNQNVPMHLAWWGYICPWILRAPITPGVGEDVEASPEILGMSELLGIELHLGVVGVVSQHTLSSPCKGANPKGLCLWLAVDPTSLNPGVPSCTAG